MILAELGIIIRTEKQGAVVFNAEIGSKRFLLFPPQASATLKPYPRFHPLARRSQLNFYEMSPEEVGTLGEEGGMQTTLQSGDMCVIVTRLIFIFASLFIPPFWSHHVTNIDSSFSFNIFTKSPYHDTIVESTNMAVKCALAIKKSLASNKRLTEAMPCTIFLAQYFVQYLLREVQKAVTGFLEASVSPEKPWIVREENVEAWLRRHWIGTCSVDNLVTLRRTVRKAMAERPPRYRG